MSITRFRMRKLWRSAPTPLRLAAIYLVLLLLMTALSRGQGFGSPEGLGLGYVAVTAAIVVLRLVLLVVLPAAIAFRAASHLVSLLCWAAAQRAVRVKTLVKDES